MASHHPSEIDSYATDSVASSPRSDVHHGDAHPHAHARVRFMCSFGGKIVPRPHDNQLRYVGGDTRIVAVHRTTTFSSLISKLSKLTGTSNVIVKYQLPNEDLDALISVTTDEDVENMIDEYDRVVQNQNPKSTRLRLFLFPNGGEEYSRTSSIASLLQGSANRDNWFIDALNSGGLERNRSEASSIVSEVPDYLFGLDNSDDAQPKLKTRPVLQESVSVSDPGSPAPPPVAPSQFSSIPDLPPVKTKPDDPSPCLVADPKDSPAAVAAADVAGFIPGNPVLHYVAGPNYSGHAVHPAPVYYMPGHVAQPQPHVNVTSVPLQHVPMRTQYVQVQQYPPPHSAMAGQVPVGYPHPVSGLGQVYGGVRQAAAVDPRDVSPRVMAVGDGAGHHLFYGVPNSGHPMAGFTGMVVPGGEELRGPGPDMKPGKITHS